MSEAKGSPTLIEFDPTIIPYQYEVIKSVRKTFDYSIGTHEILLSGSVGSAKSILMAHVAVTHCLLNSGACLGIGRRAMPDLKDTIFRDICDHIQSDLVEGKDFEINETRASIKFRNGSKIVSRSWSDKKYKKWRSLKLSAAIVEELTENNLEDKEAYDEMKMRVGRVPGVTENFIISATNPDDPSHWAYKYWELGRNKPSKKTRHVYYSVTTDNPFLPPQYISQLEEDLDPLMAQRMIHGRWIRISGETIYHQYTKEHNFRDEKYVVNQREPVHISFDFNIGEGKPMSCVLSQFIGGSFHFFNEVIVHGARTQDIMEELANRELLEYDTKYYIFGDATGKSRDTRSKLSDYDIIRDFLTKYQQKPLRQGGSYRRLNFQQRVPLANPPIRLRHNTVNSYMKNAKGQHRLFVYKDAPTLDEGFSLTKLMKNGNYIEDDGPSCPYQHCTTAAGYNIITHVEQIRNHTPVRMLNR